MTSHVRWFFSVRIFGMKIGTGFDQRTHDAFVTSFMERRTSDGVFRVNIGTGFEQRVDNTIVMSLMERRISSSHLGLGVGAGAEEDFQSLEMTESSGEKQRSLFQPTHGRCLYICTRLDECLQNIWLIKKHGVFHEVRSRGEAGRKKFFRAAYVTAMNGSDELSFRRVHAMSHRKNATAAWDRTRK